jgi:hypothetical protein
MEVTIMKKAIKWLFVTIISVLLLSCLQDPVDIPDSGDIFFLSNFSGDPTTTFQSGEDFFMHFCLVNTTNDTLDFTVGDSRPPVTFYIYKNGIQIASSIDGLCFAHVVMYYKLDPGDTLKGLWLAPTAPILSSHNILSPGRYKARAVFPEFVELQTDTISDIIFNVVE